MHRHPPRGSAALAAVVYLALAIVLAAVLAACSSAAPATPGPAASHGPSQAPATSAAAAVAAVQAVTPWFDGVKAKDPNAIGQSAWWEATGGPEGWAVTMTLGWGDCQAGCISKHTWTWQVAANGTVTFGSETGPALPADQATTLAAAATVTGVGGSVTAGPTCPVMRVGDTSCDERPVAGAVLVVRDGKGGEVARVTTDGSGLYRIPLPAGSYTLEPQAMKGLMGTAPATPFTVGSGLSIVPVSYDTGIR